MRIPGIKTAEKVSRWVRARILGGALILGYHRIAHPDADPYEVCVSPQNFAGHLEILRKFTNPISLFQLVQQIRDGSLPPKSVAVTFDDGYADNLYNAKPLLEKFSIPATVFVCTGYIGREFWWDELERLVKTSQAKPQSLQLMVGSDRFQWDRPKQSQEAGGPEDGAARKRFWQALYRFLLRLDIGDQDYAMDIIRTWSGLSGLYIPDARAMTHQELFELSEGSLIEIGSHTRNHLMLPRLPVERQWDEIASGKNDLEAVLGRRIAGFAYPNGMATADTRRIVSELGFSYACTSLHDVVRSGSDLHELTRFWQKDVDADKFMSGLNLWMKTR